MSNEMEVRAKMVKLRDDSLERVIEAHEAVAELAKKVWMPNEKAQFENGYVNGFENGYKHGAANAAAWIPVGDRLPTEPRWCWVTIDVDRSAKRAFYQGGEFDIGGDVIRGVLAWMPYQKPKPYEALNKTEAKS